MMEELLKQLDTLYNECCEGNWGGYQEEPVQKETVEKVIRFLKLFKEEDLPFCYEDAFCPSPDGSVSIEWFNTISNQFGVDIHCSYKKLVMAGIMNGSTFSGAIEYDENSIPEIILTMIQQLKETRKNEN